ncbi:triose-phosphate transporter family-domain-containing protein [Gilbertella persicaria]|uniref:triose-phosphate transporter family-domain-containing protein n=1 Tax=Gilbertella persicaria TaxID=101096 RepID=UPI00221F20A2|nr:triose-phosphate transporter family-domain-containing protein [Gilbertella persicaria]KAI8061809.1 triose-phosphate transporter family-domain-containing protein [Gilbertella persicaria]
MTTHLKTHYSQSRVSEESQYSLQDDDPLSLPSETLLNEPATKERQVQQRKSIVKTSAINLFWIFSWYIFATILSVYNKWMFSEDHYNFRYPLFVTSVHMIVQFIFSGTSILLVPQLRPTKRPSVSDYIYKILPCALATSLDIGLSNLSLKTITLSFYSKSSHDKIVTESLLAMCKSSTLAFVLIFAFIFKLEKPNWKLILIIVIITVGVVLMVSDETDFNVVGFIQVMTAAACGGLRWSLTEVLLRKESMGLTNPFASIFFLAPSQAIILLIISAGVEGYVTIFKSAFFITFGEGMHTIGIILAGGSLAFFMIMSEFFLIKRTSVVTLSVCGIFKEVATIFISSLVFGDVLTIINIIGLCITLFGIGLYNWLKFKVIAAKAHKETASLETEEQHRVVDGLQEVDSDEFDDNDMIRHNHMYSTVAESTPILLIDGGLTNYRDSEDYNRRSTEDRFEMI